MATINQLVRKPRKRKAAKSDKLYTLPDDTLVLPGHGPTTTIGFEKQHNPFVPAL